ncbi:MAG: AbrB/MazE/SpoVT family DNA-binding domain-containing protein [Symploca sp. SIO1A3]|nr:AbrB/MazE/SpoVT family DNA-binding domain-containing protein [Symploca sp. SIO2C1]NER49963.1 AbrB/MazE/SpoVT family DNA-binding domain-containing protein [Symploca sp. SIO1A3]
MASSTITSKGQVTIPKPIRDYLNLDTGSRIDFVIDEKGDVRVIPLNTAIESLSGILYRQEMKAATLEDMEEAIQEGASDWT